jgi:hypothetical protein
VDSKEMENAMKYFLISIATLLMPNLVTAATVQTSAPNTVSIGETFTVEIVGSDFPITQGGGFNLTYNPDIISATDISIDDTQTWTFFNNTGTIDSQNGALLDVIVSDFPGRSGDFNVASIEFIAVGVGISNFSLSESVINPWASDGNLISPTLLSESSVQVVPLPATFFLFGSGLLGLIGTLKRSKIFA